MSESSPTKKRKIVEYNGIDLLAKSIVDLSREGFPFWKLEINYGTYLSKKAWLRYSDPRRSKEFYFVSLEKALSFWDQYLSKMAENKTLQIGGNLSLFNPKFSPWDPLSYKITQLKQDIKDKLLETGFCIIDYKENHYICHKPMTVRLKKITFT